MNPQKTVHFDICVQSILKKSMTENESRYRAYLMDELKRRQHRNPSYSLRAFARDLGVPASRLSEIITGKCGPSVKRAEDMIKTLDWSEEQKTHFLDLVCAEHHRHPVARQSAQQRLALRNESSPRLLNTEEFSLISEWYYTSLIELLYTKLESYSADYLGTRLGIDEITIAEAIIKLQEMQLVEWRNGQLVPTNTRRTTTRGTVSADVRKYHKQLLKKAEVAIDTQPLEKRSITSMMVAMDPSQVAMVQDRIRQFRLELLKELEVSTNKSAVYCMSLNFFEVTTPTPADDANNDKQI